MTFSLDHSIRRLNRYIKKLFTQGLSPHEIGLSIAVASFWGVIPFIGVATPAVTFLCLRWKLNLPIAMFFTYALSPLHIGLFIPFIYGGEWILGVDHLPITWEVMKQEFSDDIRQALLDRGWQLLYGLIGWVILMLPISMAVYFLTKFIVTRSHKSKVGE